MNIFWNTIANYNATTWLYQLFFIVIGVVLSFLLIFKPSKVVTLSMKFYFALLFAWIAVVYYFIFCEPRGYNTILSFFWAIIAGIWIWDAITGYTKFSNEHKYAKLAYVLIFTPLVYPLLSLARGLSFPEMTSPIMPCAVTTFTIGVLLLKAQKVNMFIVLFLCHWSLIGLIKTYFYNIPEDFLLVGLSIPAIYLFLKEYFLLHLPKETKPNGKYIQYLLLGVCIGIAILLSYTFIQELKLHSFI